LSDFKAYFVRSSRMYAGFLVMQMLNTSQARFHPQQLRCLFHHLLHEHKQCIYLSVTVIYSHSMNINNAYAECHYQLFPHINNVVSILSGFPTS